MQTMINLLLGVLIVALVAAIIAAPRIEERFWNYNGKKKGDDDG
jgi:hypothetical protein